MDERLPIRRSRHGLPSVRHQRDLDAIIDSQTILVGSFAIAGPLHAFYFRWLRQFDLYPTGAGSAEIQLRPLPYRPSLMCSNLCSGLLPESYTLEAVALAPDEASATLRPSVEKISNSSKQGSDCFVAKTVKHTKHARYRRKPINVPQPVNRQPLRSAGGRVHPGERFSAGQ